MERRLRLSVNDRRILLEALACLFEAQAKKGRFDEAEKTLKLGSALSRNVTGRRQSLGLWVERGNWRQHHKNLLEQAKQNEE